MYDYDIIYIGGGLNYAGAVIAAKNGKKAALIEKDMGMLGGVCLHKGCIPSKMFLHYAQTVFASKNPLFKGELSLDIAKLTQKKEAMLANITKAIQKQCSHVDLIEGEGKLVAPNTVRVGEKTLRAKHIVIGTGSSPFIPEGIAYNAKDIITSDEVLTLTAFPQKVAIYGSGAIGLEMASFFATAGVETVLITRREKLLKNAHAKIDAALKKQLEHIGVTLKIASIQTAKSGEKGVHLLFENGEESVVPLLLVATGRKPNTDVIATKEIKVEKGIVTDAYFETSLENHYAIGDCNAKVQLAHAARAQALFVTDSILGKNPRALDLDHVVRFIHTQPMSYASVGKIKSTLEKEGISFKESLVPLSQFAYSFYNDAAEGMMVSYVDEEGFILGAEILSPHAEELIASVATALAGEMDAAQAKRTILAHPTFSEALERTFFRL